jgi:hypothetical protein
MVSSQKWCGSLFIKSNEHSVSSIMTTIIALTFADKRLQIAHGGRFEIDMLKDNAFAGAVFKGLDASDGDHSISVRALVIGEFGVRHGRLI